MESPSNKRKLFAKKVLHRRPARNCSVHDQYLKFLRMRVRDHTDCEVLCAITSKVAKDVVRVVIEIRRPSVAVSSAKGL